MTTTTTQSPPPPEQPRKRTFPFSGIIIAAAVAAFVIFLLVTPEEFLTYTQDWFLAKTQMIGYAVCHQIESHTFVICGRPLPLCARCTGTFIGALVGFFGQAVVLRRGRAVNFPSPLVIGILVVFMALWAADGLNSLLATDRLNAALVALLHVRNLYEPQQWLRLTTGALNGLTMSALVYPAFNATMWRNPLLERSIRGLRDLGVLVLLEVGVVGLVVAAAEPLSLIGAAFDAFRYVSRSNFLLNAGSLLLSVGIVWQCVMLYLLAFLGALGVLSLLTSVNYMLVLIIVQRDNAVDNWRIALVLLLAGFTVSFVQIAMISVMRYGFTRSFLPLALP
jgi:uncharacterized membrane protein